MAFVTDHGPKIMQWLKSDRTTPYPTDAPIVGVITIEDIIEELIQESVEDEVDLLVRHNQARMTMQVCAQARGVAPCRPARTRRWDEPAADLSRCA